MELRKRQPFRWGKTRVPWHSSSPLGARDIVTARGRGPQLKPCASASFCLFPGPWLSPGRTLWHWKLLPAPEKQLDHKTSTWQGRTWFLPHGGERRRLTGLAQLPQAPLLTIGVPSKVWVLSFLLSLWRVSEFCRRVPGSATWSFRDYLQPPLSNLLTIVVLSPPTHFSLLTSIH